MRVEECENNNDVELMLLIFMNFYDFLALRDPRKKRGKVLSVLCLIEVG